MRIAICTGVTEATAGNDDAAFQAIEVQVLIRTAAIMPFCKT